MKKEMLKAITKLLDLDAELDILKGETYMYLTEIMEELEEEIDTQKYKNLEAILNKGRI